MRIIEILEDYNKYKHLFKTKDSYDIVDWVECDLSWLGSEVTKQQLDNLKLFLLDQQPNVLLYAVKRLYFTNNTIRNFIETNHIIMDKIKNNEDKIDREMIRKIEQKRNINICAYCHNVIDETLKRI